MLQGLFTSPILSIDTLHPGYEDHDETIMPLPNLEQCRAPYRYLYRLLSVQGTVDLEEWLQHPVFF
ncbi:hypothetical protein [Bacillus pseudomycoides]|uniref:hypothetical protein n=1 Tax=Bacillus pseudomycoides TaxID=64104 RepID=UPI000BED7BD3|nr:hypothetical protein [Bacillus pseudomycoides]PEB39277.1 hypothetical protein COO06_24315 [Bacillus pseudomycoides]PGD96281.1 hypothetical protein COM50_13970 [Bacillus pseudomycoides]PGE05369.1 hypothetical protein COM49_03940 [Bacillus pseudomycoides]PHE71830.1 hypothetical protein COF69_01065 [Bacillus pseudomycoides]PHG16808.1 hypothetical protein COI47_24835 [Bacillus pseudomycoides]